MNEVQWYDWHAVLCKEGYLCSSCAYGNEPQLRLVPQREHA